ATSYLSLHNLAVSPAYVLDGLAASIASLLGLTGSPFTETAGLVWGRPLLLGLIVLAIVRVRQPAPIPRWFWVSLTILLSFWLLPAANTNVFRPPTSSRYMYIGAILILLVAAELAAGIRLKWPGVAIALAIGGLAAISGASILHQWYTAFADQT